MSCLCYNLEYHLSDHKDSYWNLDENAGQWASQRHTDSYSVLNV